MVIHLGINPIDGNVATYDTVNKCKSDEYKLDKDAFLTKTFSVLQDDNHEKIETFFQSIKQRFNEEIGNITICLDGNYLNQIRLTFFEAAKRHGYANFSILDSISALYLNAIFKSIYKSQNDDLIWIIWSERCYVFKHIDHGITLIGSYRNASKADQNFIATLPSPTAIFYYFYETNKIPYDLFPKTKFYYFPIFKPENVALINSKMISQSINNWKPILILNWRFGRKIEIFVNDKSLLTILSETEIPYKKKTLDISDDEIPPYRIKILENDKFSQPHFTTNSKEIVVSINLNGIYSIKDSNPFQPNQSVDNKYSTIRPIPKMRTKISDSSSLSTKVSRRQTIQINATENKESTTKTSENIKIPEYVIPHQFQLYANMIRQVGNIQIELHVIEPLIMITSLELSMDNIEKLQASIKPLVAVLQTFENSIKNIKNKFRDLDESEDNQWHKKLKEMIDSVALQFANIQQQFRANQKILQDAEIYLSLYNTETEWIKSSQKILDAFKFDNIQNSLNALKEFKVLKKEIKNHQENFEKLKTEEHSFVMEKNKEAFEIMIEDFKKLWNIFDEKMKSCSIIVKYVQKAAKCCTNANVIEDWIRDKTDAITAEMPSIFSEEVFENFQKSLNETEAYYSKITDFEKEATKIQESISSNNLSSQLAAFLKALENRSERINKSNNELIGDLKNQLKGMEDAKHLTELNGKCDDLEKWLKEILSKMEVKITDENFEEIDKYLEVTKIEMEQKHDNDMKLLMNGIEKISVSDQTKIKYYQISEMWKNVEKLLDEKIEELTVFKKDKIESEIPIEENQHISENEDKDDGEKFREISVDENVPEQENSTPYPTIPPSDPTPIKLYIPKEKYLIPKKLKNYDEKISAVGIDLGTSRCCMAVNRCNKMETVALDNNGERPLPSFVAFDEEHAKCGKVVLEGFLKDKERYTVFDIKRFIGKEFHEIICDKSWPFHVFEDEGAVKIKTENANGEMVKSPEEISAILLKYMKEKVSIFQGKILSEAVLTVPAAFTQSQKDATLAAAKLAGWNAIHLLPEPIAASFAYFNNREIPEFSNVLLFDLGGGTLDVCLFKIIDGCLQIISNNGDTCLGGRDIDNLLIRHFTTVLKYKYGINVNERIRRRYKLMLECQTIKHNLTVRENDILIAETFDANVDGTVEIERHELEEMMTELLQRMKISINQTLNNGNIKHTEINKVLLVGGGCRMPIVKEMLLKMFPQAEQCCEEQPDEVVAVGAAIYAYHLASMNDVDDNEEDL